MSTSRPQLRIRAPSSYKLGQKGNFKKKDFQGMKLMNLTSSFLETKIFDVFELII